MRSSIQNITFIRFHGIFLISKHVKFLLHHTKAELFLSVSDIVKTGNAADGGETYLVNVENLKSRSELQNILLHKTQAVIKLVVFCDY